MESGWVITPTPFVVPDGPNPSTWAVTTACSCSTERFDERSLTCSPLGNGRLPPAIVRGMASAAFRRPRCLRATKAGSVRQGRLGERLHEGQDGVRSRHSGQSQGNRRTGPDLDLGKCDVGRRPGGRQVDAESLQRPLVAGTVRRLRGTVGARAYRSNANRLRRVRSGVRDGGGGPGWGCQPCLPGHWA